MFVCIILLVLPLKPAKEWKSKAIETEVTELYTYIYIDSNDDFITYGFPGEGTKENPYLIQNRWMTSPTWDTAIYIKNIDKHFVIKNCDFIIEEGLIIRNITSTAKIINNTFDCGFPASISIRDSANILIENNSMVAHSCYFNNVSNIRMYNNLINRTNNLEMYQVRESVFENNSFLNGVGVGILIKQNSNYNVFVSNLFYRNFHSAIDIENSFNNTLFWNNFTDNGGGNFQVYDHVFQGNYWYNETIMEGNWWSDYNGDPQGYDVGLNWDKYPLGKFPEETTTPTTTEKNTTLRDALIGAGLIIGTVGISVVVIWFKKYR